MGLDSNSVLISEVELRVVCPVCFTVSLKDLEHLQGRKLSIGPTEKTAENFPLGHYISAERSGVC